MGQALLQVAGLRCERDGRLLFSDLCFSLNSGQVIQLAGPNGSGKTSLLRTLFDLVPRQAGEILWRGQDVKKNHYNFSLEVLYLGHSTGIKSALSPRENLHWYFSLRQAITPAKVDSALEEIGLAGYEDTPCYRLSAGQQRRAALARLLLSDACVWIIDEAFTAIDRAGVAELEAIITAFANRGGAVLLTTHHKLGTNCPVTVIELQGEPA